MDDSTYADVVEGKEHYHLTMFLIPSTTSASTSVSCQLGNATFKQYTMISIGSATRDYIILIRIHIFVKL